MGQSHPWLTRYLLYQSQYHAGSPRSNCCCLCLEKWVHALCFGILYLSKPQPVCKILSHMAVGTIPETFYFPTRTMSELWAHAERMVSAYEQWINAEHKHECKVNGEQYMKARLTIYLESLGSYPYIVFCR